MFLSAWTINAQKIVVDNSQTPQQLIENHLVEGCVEVSNITSTSNGSINGLTSYGYFERDLSNFPFENGILLATGNASSAGNSTNDNILNEGEDNWGTDTDLETALGITNTLNATTIEFDFVSISNLIQFNYILASEEYFGNFPCEYSDGFAFLIREAGTGNPYQNIALIPGTTIPVNTNTIHDEIVGFCDEENEEFFDGYSLGDTNYNGRTTVLTASANITPNVQYHIKLVIADQTDENYDSAVFIQGNSFNPTVDLGPDITTCATSYTLDGDIQNPLANYEWFQNGALMAGENGTTLDVTVSGTYQVRITIPINGEDCVIEDTVEVTLDSEQTAAALPNLEVCDDLSNDGVETFDLSVQDAEVLAIMPPANYDISYHFTLNAAQNNVSPIVGLIQNTINPQTIHVRILDTDSGCLAYTSFQLIVNPLPTINTPVHQEICDDQVADGSTTIDLESYNDEITGGNTNYIVTYHTTLSDSQTGANPIPSPYVNTSQNEIIYVRVVDALTGCEITTSFTIEILDLPDVSNISLPALDACEQDDDGFAFFDLTEVIPDILAEVSDVTITFHETQQDALDGTNPIADASNYENTVQNTQTLYIRIEDNQTGCAAIINLTIHTNLLITGTGVQDFYECDDQSADGVEDFDLLEIIDTIANNIEDLTITFYETQDDFDNGVNALDETVPYTVSTSPTTLIVHIVSSSCERVVEINLFINPPVIIPTIDPIDYCDTDDDGFISIELPALDGIVTNGLTNVGVTYYLTENDAENDENPLGVFHTNTSNPENLYVRVFDVITGCFDTSPITINVIPAPTVMQPNDIIICDTDQDAQSIIDLDAQIPNIVSSTNDLAISFHQTLDDANNDTNPIINTTAYNASNETIHIRVGSTITTCFALVTLDVIINTEPLFPNISNFQQCETDGNQTADFIFQDKDAEILNGQAGKEVFYFETQADAIARTNIIDKTVIYTNTSSPQTIFVRVENTSDQDCFGVDSFELEVGSIPIFTPPTNFIVCDDITNDGFFEFDLTEKVTEIATGTPETLDITFHASFDDADNAENALPLTYTNIENPQQIYVRIENGTYCHAIAEFGLNVIQVPMANLPSAIEECDDDYDGFTTFDLTISEFEILDVRDDDIEISYFETEADLEADVNEITTPDNYTNIENPQTVYVKVENVVSECFLSIPLELIVNLPPPINDLPILEICENDESEFSLAEATSILIDDLTDVNVAYYNNQTDAENQTNPLADPYTYSSVNDQLFIRASYGSTGCFIIQSFVVQVNPNPIANTPDDMEACDDDYDAMLNFAFENQTPQILGGLSGLDFSVNYYETESDAETASNEISASSYNATDGQQIFARIENNITGCYSTTSFFTFVHRKPLVEIEDQVICLDNLPLTVSAETGFVDDTYLWSTGEITPSIDIAAIGDYSVTVTTIFGCETIHDFSVTESELATIEITETVDFSDPNNITITISGIGNYLYQLDDGEPQESNVFENVTLGYHTVTVIDLNGCGSVTTEVLVIDAPKFFTPNSDGYFDTWHIVGVETLPGTTIHIFDRYGKQLHYLTSTSEGWNGVYNGNIMPSSDYWFVARVVSGNEVFEVKGHFALRR